MRIDGILSICFLAISFGIGAFAVRRVKTLADYYVAGGSMPWYLLAGSFIAANASAALFLGATNVAGGVGYTFWCGYFTTATGILFALLGGVWCQQPLVEISGKGLRAHDKLRRASRKCGGSHARQSERAEPGS